MPDSNSETNSATGATYRLPSGWFRPRREEWVMLALVSICVVVSIAASGDLDLFSVWQRYISYFGIYLGLLCFAAWWLRDRGKPIFSRQRVQGISDRLFGEPVPGTTSYRTPVYELVRGVLVFALCLSGYTNVKVRYMYLNRIGFDELYESWDVALGLDKVAAQCVRWTQDNPWFEKLLESAYFHDYFFMIAIVSLFFFRGNVRGIRVAFAAAGITYISCILISAAAPSFGPWALTPDAYDFITSEKVKGAQGMLGWWYKTNLESFTAGKGVNAEAFKGIAAFPSLHVGHMALVIYLSGKKFPWLTFATVVSLGLTFIATLAFGWHWAIDAPVGAGIAWLGYRSACWLVKDDAVVETTRTEGP